MGWDEKFHAAVFSLQTIREPINKFSLEENVISWSVANRETVRILRPICKAID